MVHKRKHRGDSHGGESEGDNHSQLPAGWDVGVGPLEQVSAFKGNAGPLLTSILDDEGNARIDLYKFIEVEIEQRKTHESDENVKVKWTDAINVLFVAAIMPMKNSREAKTFH